MTKNKRLENQLKDRQSFMTESSTTTTERSLLLAKLEEQQERHRRLRAKVELQEARRAEMQVHIKETLVVAEQEEEAITNHLLRRLDSLYRERTSLATQLSDEETIKQQQEQKLLQLKKSRMAMESELRQEETTIRERLERQLRSLQSQREFITEKTAEEATTLRQLRDCVERLQREATCAALQTSPSSTDRGGTPSRGLAEADSAIGSVECSSSNHRSDTPQSSLTSTTLNDPTMTHCLESEIAVVEALRDEAATRAASYSQRVVELKKSIAEAERTCEAQRVALDAVRHELSCTTNAANELHANNEVIAEWMMDREMFGHTAHLRSSSVCSNASTRTVETSASDWTESTPHVLHRNDATKP